MLNKLTVIEEGFTYKIKAFKEGREFIFKPGINLIVGENGAGKSIMIKTMLGNGNLHGKVVAKIDGSGAFSFLDAEKDNPRTKNPELLPSSLYGFGVASRMMMSHGETMKPILSAFDKDKSFEPGTLIIIDEPEMALSIKSQLDVAELWEKGVKTKDLQFLVATHSPVFMTIKDANIISLDDTYDKVMKWLKGIKK